MIHIIEWRHFTRHDNWADHDFEDLGDALGIAYFSGQNNECALECVIDDDGDTYVPIERFEYPGVWALVVDHE